MDERTGDESRRQPEQSDGATPSLRERTIAADSVDVLRVQASPEPRWFVASATGRNHRDQHLPNQDRGLVGQLPTGGIVLSVADGAGSRRYSDQGAQAAVESAVHAADSVFAMQPADAYSAWSRLASEYAGRCLQAFDRQVAQRVHTARTSQDGGDPRREYATTLLALVADPPWFVVVSIGDCFLVVNRDPEGPRLLVPPPTDREHGGATHFLTSSGREDHLSIFVLKDPRISGLALCTDGLQEGVLRFGSGLKGPTPFVPGEFEQYFRFVAARESREEELTAKLDGEEFAATSGDDKTMVIAVWR